MQCCTQKKRGQSEPPKDAQDDQIAIAGGPDDPSANDDKSKGVKENGNSGREMNNRSSSCCAGLSNALRGGRGKKRSQAASKNASQGGAGGQNEDGQNFSDTNKEQKSVNDRQFMMHLAQQGGVEHDMLEYLKDFIKVKSSDFSKVERDMIAVIVKQIVSKERQAFSLINHLVEQPKLRKYEQNMRNYMEKIRDGLKNRLVELSQLLQSKCLALADNAESKASFLNLIGDVIRYQIQLYREESLPYEQLTSMQKKAKRERDILLKNANEVYQEAFRLSVTYLSCCNAIRLSVALNYTIFLAEFRNDQVKALKILQVVHELALTEIDDSADPDSNFTLEETDLITFISNNIDMWKLELEEKKAHESREEMGQLQLNNNSGTNTIESQDMSVVKILQTN